MEKTPKVLAFAGSLRKGSINKKLLHFAADLARAEGVEVEVVDLFDYPAPLYNADDEEENGLPESVLKLKEKMLKSDGFLIASPEYNGTMTAVLKNTIDWASRQHSDEKSLECFDSKVVCLLSASPGRLGGLRSLAHLRTVLSGIGAFVCPKEFALPGAYSAFEEEGRLKNPEQLAQLKTTVNNYISILKKF